MKHILFSVLILPNILFGMDHISKQTKNKLKPVVAQCIELSNELVKKNKIDKSNVLMGAYLEINNLLHNKIKLSPTIKEIANQAYLKARNAQGIEKAFQQSILFLRPDHTAILRNECLIDALKNIANNSKIKDLNFFLEGDKAENIILKNIEINDSAEKNIAVAYAYLYMKKVDSCSIMNSTNINCFIQ